MRLMVVGICGASGVVYAIRLLSVLKELNIERHLVITRLGERIIEHETDMTVEEVRKLASKSYDADDLTAPIASGSFKADGMVVIPCSMKSLAGIASGYSDNLMLRAADVTLKEGRRLVLVVRETPLSPIHLQNMVRLANAGVTMLPAMPAWYNKPKTIDDLVDHIVGKVLNIFNIEHKLYKEWKGM